jgi:WD40 repeat protein
VRWSLPDGRVLATAEDHATTVDVVEASPRGGMLASAARNAEVVLRDADDLEPRLRIAGAHVGPVTALAFSPDGMRLGTAGHDGTLAVWDVTDGRTLARLDLAHGPVDDALWTAEGFHAAVDGDLVRWSGIASEPPELVHTSSAAGLRIRRVAALPGVGFVVGADDGTIARLEAGHDEPRWLRPTFGRAVTDLAVTTDGERIAVASQDQRIRLHDARTGTLLMTVGEHESTATAVAWSPDGTTLASGGFDKQARVWRSR